jgi:hypothetical protein
MVTTAATPFIGLAFLGQSGVWVVGAMTVMFLAHVFLTLRETRLPTDPPRHGQEFTA